MSGIGGTADLAWKARQLAFDPKRRFAAMQLRVLQFLQRSDLDLPNLLAPSAARAGLSGELPKHRNKIKCRCIRYTISHDKSVLRN